MRDSQKITIDWLHSINWLQTDFPEGWNNGRRGVSYANWTIHSIVQNGNYDDGPFVWTVMPTHGQNMIPLPKQRAMFVVLVLEDREDVMRLLAILGRGGKHDWCADVNCEKCNRRLTAEQQSYDDLAASGGIVDAP